LQILAATTWFLILDLLEFEVNKDGSPLYTLKIGLPSFYKFPLDSGYQTNETLYRHYSLPIFKGYFSSTKTPNP